MSVMKVMLRWHQDDGFALNCHHQVWPAPITAATHVHDSIEIVYITKGGGTNVIGGIPYPMIPGDLYAIAIGDTHGFTVNPRVEFYNILFQPRLFESGETEERGVCAEFLARFAKKSGEKLGKITLPPAAHGEIARILSQLAGELVARRTGYRSMAKALFISFLVRVCRHCREERGSGAAAEGPIAQALGYIHEHFHEPISVGDLAGMADLSANHFGELFKAKTGNSVKSYLNRVRVERARFLLEHDDHRITDVALSCGFQDLSYFARVFKQVTGKTPRRYRHC